MSRQHYVEQTISELGAEFGIPELTADETGRASFSSNGIHVTLSYVSEPVEQLWVFLDLGEIDGENTQLLNGLLQLGFSTWSSNCMTIGINEEGNRALGHSSIPVVYLDCNKLRDLVELMLENAAGVREWIVQGNYELAGNV